MQIKIFLNRGKIHQHCSWLIDFQPSPSRQLAIRCFVTLLSSRHVSFECQEIHSHHRILVFLQLSWSCCSDLRHFIPTPLCKDLLLPKVQWLCHCAAPGALEAEMWRRCVCVLMAQQGHLHGLAEICPDRFCYPRSERDAGCGQKPLSLLHLIMNNPISRNSEAGEIGILSVLAVMAHMARSRR